MCSAAFSCSSGMEEASAEITRSGSSKTRSMTKSPAIISEIASANQTMPLRRAIVLKHSIASTIWEKLEPVNFAESAGSSRLRWRIFLRLDTRLTREPAAGRFAPCRFVITQARPSDAPLVADLVGELLQEIMTAIGAKAFEFSGSRPKRGRGMAGRRDLYGVVGVSRREGCRFSGPVGKPCPLCRRRIRDHSGIVCAPGIRVLQRGMALVAEAKKLSTSRGWTRLEVTTPPLPQFDRTLAFYERQGFSISGGRKMKLSPVIRPVIQEERTGCGIAAAAALAGVSYARAKAVAASLGISAQDPKLWSETASVRRLLTQFGLRPSRRPNRFAPGPVCRIARCWPSSGIWSRDDRSGIGSCSCERTTGRTW